MVRFVFTLEDLALTRFAISPMFELSDSLRALRAPDVAALHVPWIERLKGRVSDLDLGTALRLHQPRGYTPDFITPPPGGPLAEFGEEIELVRKVPAAQVRRDIEIYGRRHGWTPDIQAFIDHPRREARRLADTLEAYYEIAIAPYWPRIRALLQADIAHRSRELVQRGPAALFGSLHRNVDWQRDMVRVHQDFDDTVPLRGLGLLLMPSAF